MKVVTGSKNVPKQLAVAEAFGKIYPHDFIELTTVNVESGVSSHPTTAEESIKGAMNRIAHAKTAHPGADFYVGIEGGLSRMDNRAWEHSWVAIEDKRGRICTAVGAGLEMRGKLLEAILNGQELGEAFAEQYGVEDVGNKAGMFGYATDGLVTRQSATAEAVIFALAGFLHPEYLQ